MTCASRGPVHGLIVDSAPSAGKPQASMQRRGATPHRPAGTSDGSSRSVRAGSAPDGQQRTTADKSGHQTFGEPAGRCPYSSVTLYGADGRSGVRVSPPMDAMACQRFARDDASVCHACRCVAAWAKPVDLRECGGTDSEAQGFEVAARAWHARGQGFMPPQLHHSIWGALCPIRARGLDRRSPAGSEPAGQQADALMSGAALSRR